MTALASNVLVGASQRERGSLVMIKIGGFPARGVVTTGAIRGVLSGRELSGMGIVVASGALLRRRAKIHILEAGLDAGRTVAISAGDAAVRPEKRERGFGMVEARQNHPVRSAVASLATHRSTVRPLSRHLCVELALVRVDVTGCAGAVVESVSHRNDRGWGYRLMAVRTEDGEVSAGQRETGVLVPRQRKLCRFEAPQVVT